MPFPTKSDQDNSAQDDPIAVPLSLFLERQFLIASEYENNMTRKEEQRSPPSSSYRNTAANIDLTWLQNEEKDLTQPLMRDGKHGKKSKRKKRLQPLQQQRKSSPPPVSSPVLESANSVTATSASCHTGSSTEPWIVVQTKRSSLNRCK